MTSPANPKAPSAGPVQLLTVDEACLQLRVSRWTFYRLIRTGAVQTVKIGSRRLVPAKALDELVQALATEAK